MGTEQARDAAVGRGGPAACMTVAPQGHGKDTKPGPTRRMPSDATTNLWQAELDTLE